MVSIGTPLVRVQNWWAVMEFDAACKGMVSKNFFEPGTHVRVGDPFAIILCDPEDRPRTDESCVLRVTKQLRDKPGYREVSNFRWSDRGGSVFVEPRSGSMMWINQPRSDWRIRVAQLRR
jgi:pyruvate/2-oxoglutarate dehydrogenase complex dihydrolipoamide acyltransferase (E2) component